MTGRSAGGREGGVREKGWETECGREGGRAARGRKGGRRSVGARARGTREAAATQAGKGLGPDQVFSWSGPEMVAGAGFEPTTSGL